jgi:superfamily II DNA/RNA helicase
LEAPIYGPREPGERLAARFRSYLSERLEAFTALSARRLHRDIRASYLRDLLENNGFGGQTVILNGSNSDKDSAALYRAWATKNRGTEAVSGSKTADMKAAIVDGFRHDRSILIATESGAEGINLQFCSLLINYDLPWNPQRVEQRIGRCHRYGQKIDVTVINFLNRKNQAEERIHQLLEQKFKLFDGVFGSSDEVLGAIESGVDIECIFPKV